MNLHPKQKKAIDLAFDPVIKTLFITGEGGTGKTAILKIIADTYIKEGKDVIILAPTNEASGLIGGQTIHSFFKITPVENLDVSDEEDFISFCLTADDDIIELPNTILIIDEISMVGKELYNKVIADIEADKIILFGDPSQLQPVKDRPVRWSKIADETVTLTYNFRANNKEIKEALSNYLEDENMDNFNNFIKNEKDIIFNKNSTVIAFKNKTLNDLEYKFLNHKSYMPLKGEIVRSFGRSNLMQRNSKTKAYFENGTLLEVIDIYKQFDNNYLSFVFVKRLDAIELEDNKYYKNALVIMGDYDDYKNLLKETFNKLQEKQQELIKKYKVYNAKELQSYVRGNKLHEKDKLELSKSWKNYLSIKRVPYARNKQFMTTYKVQGKSLDDVIVYSNDLPDNQHIYVACSRAKNKLQIIK